MWFALFTDDLKKIYVGVYLQTMTEDVIKKAILELEKLLTKYDLTSKSINDIKNIYQIL